MKTVTQPFHSVNELLIKDSTTGPNQPKFQILFNKKSPPKDFIKIILSAAASFCKELSRVWYEAVFSLEDDLGKKEERRNSWEHVFPFIPKDPDTVNLTFFLFFFSVFFCFFFPNWLEKVGRKEILFRYRVSLYTKKILPLYIYLFFLYSTTYHIAFSDWA